MAALVSYLLLVSVIKMITYQSKVLVATVLGDIANHHLKPVLLSICQNSVVFNYLRVYLSAVFGHE